MLDCFNREINYLRISVTDRCNLRCTYCMPPEGISSLSHSDILSFDEILEVVKYSVSIGIRKIRITGGEPLVRKGIVDLIRMISQVQGIKELTMTTNGILLEEFAEKLAEAGLDRVNISMDATDPEMFKSITRIGDIDRVYKGIEAAKKSNLTPIKLNCVVKQSSTEKDAQDVAKYALENDLEVRFIHQMNLEYGEFSVVEGGEGGDCKLCNRLRLTPNGKIMPCLFSNISYDIREMGVEAAVLEAIKHKPECGTLNSNNKFYNVGG